MKKIILISILSIFSKFVNAQEIKWMSFNDALAEQKLNGKQILMMSTVKDNNPFTLNYMSKINSNKNLFEFISEKYLAVKFDVLGNEIVNFHGITYSNPKSEHTKTKLSEDNRNQFSKNVLKNDICPSVYIIETNGTISKPIIGMTESNKLLEILKNN